MYDMTISEAKDIIKKNDKKRASYYNYYTNKVWGDAKSYDLCIDSSKLGIGGTAKAIEDYVKLKQKIEKLHKNNLHKFNIPTYKKETN
jgi:cytidylate kinase